jgi:LemA protein
MVDATKSAMNYERGLLVDITQLRTANNFSPTKDGGKNAAKLDNVYSKLMVQLENYPKLESIAAVRDMMQTADYTEREIAASRRLYNAAVTEFNQLLYV